MWFLAILRHLESKYDYIIHPRCHMIDYFGIGLLHNACDNENVIKCMDNMGEMSKNMLNIAQFGWFFAIFGNFEIHLTLNILLSGLQNVCHSFYRSF